MSTSSTPGTRSTSWPSSRSRPLASERRVATGTSATSSPTASIGVCSWSADSGARTIRVVGVLPWPPTTEETLRAAAESGALEERHSVEVKRELAPGKSANKEAARDIASFAIDRGRLIYGVHEAAGFALTPIPLDGLAERIELVG